MYESVTSEPPFGRRSAFEVGVAHLEEAPVDPAERRADVDDGFGWALLQALAKDPKDRPPTATAYANLLGDGCESARGEGLGWIG